MKRIKIYQDGSVVYVDHGQDLSLHGVDPVEEYDVTGIADVELDAIKNNPHHPILKKFHKLNSSHSIDKVR